MNSITVEATFENGVLRPAQPLPLSQHQRVTITVQVGPAARRWPDDVAAIYQEINEEDRRLAESLFPAVRDTWPPDKEEP